MAHRVRPGAEAGGRAHHEHRGFCKGASARGAGAGTQRTTTNCLLVWFDAILRVFPASKLRANNGWQDRAFGWILSARAEGDALGAMRLHARAEDCAG